jgi:hypothetical protein
MSQEPMFPILNDPIVRAIPWALIAPHEKQAQINHGQTLKGLAGRGGLDVAEAVLIILDKPWHRESFGGIGKIKMWEYRRILMRLGFNFEKARSEAKTNLMEPG